LIEVRRAAGPAETEAALDLRSARIRLHAQIAARSLYERGGFEQVGAAFLEEGIPHLSMEKAIA
jgi:predicted GNAT family N-acyltransferase